MQKKAVSSIDCFKMIFPANDPDAASAYAKMLLPVFEFEVPEIDSNKPFSSETEVYCLPDVTVSRVKTTAARLTRTVRTIARSATDDILIVCYMSGHFTHRINAAPRRVECGEFTVFDLPQEAVIEAPFIDNVSLAVSRRRLEAVVPLLDSAHGFVVPRGALSTVLLATAEQVIALGPSLQSSEARPVADALILLVAAMLEAGTQPKPASGAAGRSVSLAVLKAAIERRLTDSSFGPQSLLDEFGMTRSTLYRAFEPLGGVSAYISERRLRYAFRQMTNPAQKDLRVSQLAFELGFSHASAFNRSFKALFGLTPKDIRTLAVRPEGEDLPFMVSPAALPYIHPIDP
uniref:helix-turn-helix domain-containing protein n=1 Tax=uncultured Rhizobium sp. TaxID=155567 RepID=UPI00260308E3|nr:helix-turn-helix domain-containing protein [uncultured Rhizobium sp.]